MIAPPGCWASARSGSWRTGGWRSVRLRGRPDLCSSSRRAPIIENDASRHGGSYIQRLSGWGICIMTIDFRTRTIDIVGHTGEFVYVYTEDYSSRVIRSAVALNGFRL